MSDGIIEALRSGQQCDEDGVMCIVSRHACHEAADIIEASKARIAELVEAIAELEEAIGEILANG
jgi:serine phosphatase RsbU (regulator of sigma subunit)